MCWNWFFGCINQRCQGSGHSAYGVVACALHRIPRRSTVHIVPDQVYLAQMLNLANLRTLLSRVLLPPELHTVALFTPEGELVCYASEPNRTKDHVRVLVGLSTETWQEERDQKVGMVECEVWLRLYFYDVEESLTKPGQLGHVLVLPIEGAKKAEDDDPLMLLALNSDKSIPFSVLETKVSIW